MTSKQCCVCKEEKDTTAFAKASARKDGLQTSCKACQKVARSTHRETHLRATENWKKNNPERAKALHNKASRKYGQNNKAKRNVLTAQRRANKLNATLPLGELNDFIIAEMYDCARLRTEMTEVSHHVDHIVPLQGEKVSGLHVAHNLQILTAEENLRKGNRYE